MRPGPGLVVMALAFISGAWRGSTSSKISSSSSASSSPSLTTSTSASYSSSSSSSSSTEQQQQQQQQPSILFPLFLGGGGVIYQTTDSKYKHKESEYSATSANDHNFYHNTYPPPPPVQPQQPPLATTAQQQLQLPAELKSSILTEVLYQKQPQFETNRNYHLQHKRSSNNNQVTSVALEEDSSVSVADSTEAIDKALPVQYPSQSSDSSRSFDEDDILALVAEDDLLSEESFDRLSKLNEEEDEDKIGYINEDDYSGGTESGLVGGGEETEEASIAAAAAAQKDISLNLDVADVVEQEESDHQEEQTQSSTLQPSFKHELNAANENNENNIYAASLVIDKDKQITETESEPEQEPEQQHQSFSQIVEKVNHHTPTIYSAAQTAIETAVENHSIGHKKRSIFESAVPLTRLNPWISACDLAQPGTATDLQVSSFRVFNYC